MLKVGVFGVGHLGKFHLNSWKEINTVELVGFYDPFDENAITVAEKYVFDEKHVSTSDTTSDFTVNATDLIKEFQAGDSAANAKYREKILTVNGIISELENPNDSTANIKFADSTGSYAIFPFQGESVAEVKKLKAGDNVSVKGSCSGGVLSEILGTESITFKRCVLNKK